MWMCSQSDSFCLYLKILNAFFPGIIKIRHLMPLHRKVPIFKYIFMGMNSSIKSLFLNPGNISLYTWLLLSISLGGHIQWLSLISYVALFFNKILSFALWFYVFIIPPFALWLYIFIKGLWSTLSKCQAPCGSDSCLLSIQELALANLWTFNCSWYKLCAFPACLQTSFDTVLWCIWKLNLFFL